MVKVILIGSGNVAQHLIKAFAKSEKIDVIQAFSRQKQALTHLLDADKITNNFNYLLLADLYIITVSDDAIAEVSSQLPFEYEINSEQRKALHVSAVFVNNFVNHLYQMGNKICTENNVPFEILKPLIQETANKIMTLSPNEAQTGPAIRNDKQTIASHLDFLLDENQKNIYQILTQSIQNHGKKL